MNEKKTPIALENGQYTVVEVQRAPRAKPLAAAMESSLTGDGDGGDVRHNNAPLHPQTRTTEHDDVRTDIKAGVEEERVDIVSPRPLVVANDSVVNAIYDDNDDDNDDDSMTQATRTDDDVIREAFDTALDVNGIAGLEDAEEDEDEDRIIWSPPK